MIYVTERAVDKIKEMSEAEGIGHFVVRVKVIGGGCAGFTHDMFYDELETEVDEVTEVNGIKVLIDPLSWQYLDEMTIDFISTSYGSGFKFLNPNAKGSCGCGSSMSF